MWHWFQKLFSSTCNPPIPRRQARLGLETFEARDLPSASPLVAAARPLADRSPARVGTMTARPMLVFDTGHGSSALTATLTGATGTSGSVSFTAGKTAGQNALQVRVSGLAANSTFDVLVDKVSVGQITTDANGVGKLTLTNLASAPVSGSVVSVVDSQGAAVLTGTLAVRDRCQQGQPLAASLTGAMGTSGIVSSEAGATSGPNDLRLRVSGLAASSTFDIQADAVSIGQITTDANGRGHVALNNLTATIAAGSVITVLDAQGATVLSGTLALGNQSGHRG